MFSGGPKRDIVKKRVNPSRPNNPGRREKFKLNFYFNTIFRNAWDVKG